MGARWEKPQTRLSAICLLVADEEFASVPEWCQHTKCPEIKSKSQRETYCVPYTILSAPDIEGSCCLEDTHTFMFTHTYLAHIQ